MVSSSDVMDIVRVSVVGGLILLLAGASWGVSPAPFF